MKIEVSTDTRVNIEIAAVTAAVESGLARYKNRLTRVEVHLSDVNGPRGGPDARCTLEARPAGRQPVAVTENAATAEQALNGAIEKMGRLLGTAFGREDDVRGGPSASGQPT